MTTAGVHEIRSNNSSEEDDPRPIELPGVGGESYNCGWSCWYLFSWVVSLILYTVECFVTVWAAYTYATTNMFIPFGISLAYLAIPQVILVTLSLTWYYNLDRYHRKRKEADPHNLEFIEYRKKFTIGAVVCHVSLLGMVYRYSQLIYLVMIRKMDNIRYLRRDTTLLRLVHSLCVSAPLVILHLYVLFQSLPVCLDPAITQCSIFEFPSLYAALGSSVATLLYSVLAFATNDRLSGKNRRVILPAHLMQVLWYICVIASRILAIVLFAFVYSYFIFAFIGGHWLLMFVFLLIQRTTFCADVISESDSKVKIKRRWCLELSFDFVAATMYIFAFFSFRRGKSRYWSAFYHLLMYAEIAAMSALFYVQTSSVPHLNLFSLTTLTLAVGLYPVGVLFKMCYYLFFHPRKTELWHWIGFPKRRGRSETITSGGFRNRTPVPDGRVAISGPTLVAHNGFIPRTMLPDNIPSSPGHENGMVTNPSEIILESARNSEQVDHNWVIPGGASASTERDLVTSLTMVSPNSTSKSTTSAPSESTPALSDRPSVEEPSEVGTDISSGVLHVPQGDIKGDTVIDTPLFGNTPDPMQHMRLNTDVTDIGGPTGTLRSLTDTVDTGIDLGADTPLTQNTNDPQDNGEFTGNEAEFYNRAREDMTLGLDIDLPQFSDIPAKRNSFIAKKSPLESHYFPDSQSHESLTPTLPAPTWGYKTPGSNRPPLGQNSSGESGEVYQSRKKTSTQQPNHHIMPLAMSTPERTRRNAPRSPKGARAFIITPGDEGKAPVMTRNRVGPSSSYPNTTESYHHHSPTRLHAPRSPKGARRMLISQPDPTPKHRPEPIEQPANRHSFTSATFYQSKSPERVPRGVLNYQRQSSGSTAKTPEGKRRNIARPAPVQKSNSMHVTSSVRSPERMPKGYRRDVAPNIQQRQYIQQQQQNRSRWDKWAAEQEEKRRQANSEAKQHVAMKHKVAGVTQSYPSTSNNRGAMPRNKSEEFDHLAPVPEPIEMTDGVHNKSASIAPQGYPRAPQGARGNTPRVGWSPGRSDRISLSPQRSIHSMPGASLMHQDIAGMSASAQIPRGPRTHIRLSQQLSAGGGYNKFYAPTSSMHQSVV